MTWGQKDGSDLNGFYFQLPQLQSQETGNIPLVSEVMMYILHWHACMMPGFSRVSGVPSLPTLKPLTLLILCNSCIGNHSYRISYVGQNHAVLKDWFSEHPSPFSRSYTLCVPPFLRYPFNTAHTAASIFCIHFSFFDKNT